MSQPEELFCSIDDFDGLTPREQTEAMLYIYAATTKAAGATGTDLENLRSQLGLAAGRSAQHLVNHHKMHGAGSFAKRSRGYALTKEKAKYWRDRLSVRPNAAKAARELRVHLARVPAGPLQDYLDETVGCFESRHLRATIVLAWCAGYYALRDWLHTNQLARLNAQMLLWKKPKAITTVEEFDELSERVVLDTSREAKILTKTTHKVLVALLDQRNSYAHPSGRSISEPVAEAFVQQVIDEMILKFM